MWQFTTNVTIDFWFIVTFAVYGTITICPTLAEKVQEKFGVMYGPYFSNFFWIILLEEIFDFIVIMLELRELT